jgi:hypothetical protein
MKDVGMTNPLLYRFFDAAKRYRRAYEVVEEAISAENNPDLPAWVFSLDGFNGDALRSLSPRVAIAEEQRRAARVALHAIAELIALEDPGSTLKTQPEMATEEVGDAEKARQWMSSLTASAGDDLYWLRVLDRFISVCHYADDGNCIYVNGAFEPVAWRDDREQTDYTRVSPGPEGK